MTDYSKMTDNELRRVIAERLGWHVEFVKPSPKLRYPKWVLFRPDGSQCPRALAKNEDPKWLYLWYVPDWPASLDIALTLPLGHRWSLVHAENGIPGYGPNTDLFQIYEYNKIIGYAARMAPARAVCEAWLAMMDSEASHAD